MRVHWSASLRDNLLPWHDVTGKQSYRSRLILFADYCFGPPTFVYRLFLLSCNKKINWKPSSGRSQEMKCSKRLIHKQFVQVSGLCGPQFLSYLPKRFMHGENSEVQIVVWNMLVPTMNGVWMCMPSEHCRGPVSKHEFSSSTWFRGNR